MAVPDIFISHSSKDAKIADALIKMLQRALPLQTKRIRCTSVEGYKLDVGDDAKEILRGEASNATSFIALITGASVESDWVLFELGARWGQQNRKIYPMLAAGATPKNLPPVIDDVTALNCDVKKDLEALVRKLGDDLKITPKNLSGYGKQRDEVIRISIDLAEQRKESQLYKVPLSSIVNKRLSSVFSEKLRGNLKCGHIEFQMNKSRKFFDMANLAHDAINKPLRLETPIKRVRSVYVLIAAGNGSEQYRNEVVGRIGLEFTYGTQWTELVLGKNIREWTRSNINDRVMDASEMGSVLTGCWQGATDTEGTGGFDRLEIPVSQTFRESTLHQIILARGKNPSLGFFLVATTIESSPAS